jgi:iron(III) transport system permease protein
MSSHTTSGAASQKLATALPPSGWRHRFDWRTAALIFVILLLVYQVAVPFAMIVWTSFKTVRPGDHGFLSFDFSLANYIRAYATQEFWSATWNTLKFATASTVSAFILGTFLSWVVERTNTPLARVLGTVTLARIIIPGILIAISWIFIASPRIGFLTDIIERMTGISQAVNIYTFWGMVWVFSLEMVPLAYLLTSAAFRALDPRLEEASTMTGAGTLRTLRRISLPLIAPAILAAMLLLFITSIETFEVPLLLGPRAGMKVYATEVYFNTSRTPVDWGLSSTYSMALLVISVMLLILYFRLLRHGERYQTITGKDYRPRRIDLGPWKYLTCAMSILLVFLITGLPFIIMLYASFLPSYVGITLQPLNVLTWANYDEILDGGINSYAAHPLWNSAVLGTGSATVVMIIVSAIAYFVHKTRIRGRQALDFLTFSAIAVPSVVLGAAFLWFYLLVPVPIIGTLIIIGLAYLTKYMPFALRFVSTSMLQIHSELEEAAQVSGVPWWKNFFHIFLPLLKPGLMAGWFWVMVHAFRELTIALMLARANNRTAAVIIYDLWENGSFQQVSAFGVLMFMLLLLLVTISQMISKRYGIKEQG